MQRTGTQPTPQTTYITDDEGDTGTIRSVSMTIVVSRDCSDQRGEKISM